MVRLYICVVLLATFACAEKKFRGVAKPGNAEIDRNVSTEGGEGILSAENNKAAFDNVLDVALLPVNDELRVAGGPTAGEQGKFEGSLDLSCDQTADSTIEVGPAKIVNVAANTRTVVNVKGRFCPTTSEGLTVVFITDFSGSMGPGKADPINSPSMPATGNDPRMTINGVQTCGRLLAVEAIVAKYKPEDQVKVGLITFAGNLIETHTAPPTDLASFRDSRLSEASRLSSFCSYIPPDPSFQTNPMALPDTANIGPGTNYTAAFQRAVQYLQGVGGRKAIYFITDGRPTGGGIDPIAAAKASANQLKSIDNLYFNAFFLQNKQAALPEDTVGFNALVDIVGATERVVKVDSAQQLALEVAKAKTAAFDPASIQATLSVAPYRPEEPLKIISFKPDPSNPAAWLFETQAFVLEGQDHELVTHHVAVTAQTLDKTAVSSHVKIIYDKNP